MPKQKLTKRADGRYSSQVYLGIVDGKREYKTVYGSSPKEVNEKAKELKILLGKGIDLSCKSTTFSDWASIWLNSIKRKSTENQYNAYKYRIEFFSDFVGKIDVIKIKLFQLQEVIDILSDNNPNTGKPSAKQTLIYYKSTVSQFFDYLIDNRIVDYNPAHNIVIPIVSPCEERRALTEEEQKRVKEFPHRAQLPAMLAMLAGLRRGEISALQWSDIDFENNTISITKSFDFKTNTIKGPKTKAGHRLVSIPDELSDFLSRQPRKSLYVVVNAEGQPMSEPAWQRLWKYYMNALNREYGDFSKIERKDKRTALPMVIDTFTLHCLRHTYATILYDAGVDVLTAKKLLGHSDVKTTLGIYTHLSAENERQNIAKLNTYLNTCKSDASQKKAKNA